MIRLRVSDLDQWERFVRPAQEEFEISPAEFLAIMKRQGPETDAMRAGSAFHSVLESAQPGAVMLNAEAGGFRFHFAGDLDVNVAPFREIMTDKTYPTPNGLVLLRGKVDGYGGIEVVDYKLTFGSFDAERYASSLQWRAYLDMMEAKRFRYVVFEARLDGAEVTVRSAHELTFWAYRDMAEDVRATVAELAEYVAAHVLEIAT